MVKACGSVYNKTCLGVEFTTKTKTDGYFVALTELRTERVTALVLKFASLTSNYPYFRSNGGKIGLCQNSNSEFLCKKFGVEKLFSYGFEVGNAGMLEMTKRDVLMSSLRILGFWKFRLKEPPIHS